MKKILEAAGGAAAAGLGHTLRIGRSAARYVPGWAGAGLVSWGAAMVYVPAGLIVAGAFLLATDALIPARPRRRSGGEL